MVACDERILATCISQFHRCSVSRCRPPDISHQSPVIESNANGQHTLYCPYFPIVFFMKRWTLSFLRKEPLSPRLGREPARYCTREDAMRLLTTTVYQMSGRTKTTVNKDMTKNAVPRFHVHEFNT